MSKQTRNKWLSISAAILMVTPIVQLHDPLEVQAVADTFTLTAINNDTISIAMNGTPQVQLPNGVIVTANSTFKATENKTYTFVGIDGLVKHQKSITMTTVPNTAKTLVVSPGELVKLNFESGDAHSGVQDMRYKIYNEGAPSTDASSETQQAFTAWESFKAQKDYTIPTVNPNTNSNWVVKAEFRDVAGNIATNVVARFVIENWAPTANINQTIRYTNKRNIDVRAVGVTKFADPHQGKIGVSSSALTTVHTLSGFPNKFTGTNVGDDRNYVYDLPFILPDVEKDHTIYFQMTKMQNTKQLVSSIVNTRVMYDKTAPTGTVVINGGEPVVPSREVRLTISTQDSLSGVDRIKIVEDGTTKERWIDNPGATIVENWNFGMNDTGRISVVVFDKAGNERTIQSQEVTFAKLNINSIELLQNRNPQVYNKDNKFEKKSAWDGTKEIMLSGSNFEFGVGYDMGVANTVDYNITGSYVVEIEKDGTTHYKSVVTNFTPRAGLIDRFESGKVNLPENMPKDANVFVNISLKAVNKANPSVVMTETTGNRLFGKIGDKNLDEAVNDAIRFNEVN